MHVKAPVDPSPRSLPRAASSLSQYRPTTHDQCKKAVEEVQKQWGHPQFITRPMSSIATTETSRSQSVPPIRITPIPGSLGAGSQERPSSAPESRVTFLEKPAEERRFSERNHREQQQQKRSSTPPRHSMMLRSSSSRAHQSSRRSERQQIHPRQREKLPLLPTDLKRQFLDEQSTGERVETPDRSKSTTIRRSGKSRPFSQMSLRSYKSSKSQAKDYSLDSLLKEINQKFGDESIQDLEFSDKEALLWGMGTSDTGLLRGDVTDPLNYQGKFEVWARSVMSKERKQLALDENSDEDSFSTLSLSSCAESEMDKLMKTGAILDVGGLHAGEYFGEVALIKRATRSASILTVTDVEVLVLSNSDFSRRLDKDVIDCLSSNNYKKSEYMLNHYNRTYKWELVKKKVMRDALLGKKERFPNRFHHDMSDALRRKGTPLL